MRRSFTRAGRALLAGGFALSGVVAAASCGGDDGGKPQVQGGSGGGGTGGELVVDGGPDVAAGGTTDTGGAAGSGGGLVEAGTDAAEAGTVAEGGPVGPAVCGNGVREGFEECDDGNETAGDGCEDNCWFSCTDARCANGLSCDGRETCGEDFTCQAGSPAPDDFFCGQNMICKAGVCIRPNAVCGDGIRIAPEECEEGVTMNDTKGVDGDGCDTDCRFSCSLELNGRSCTADECEGSPTCDNVAHVCIPGDPKGDYDPCGAGGTSVCINQLCTAVYCSNGIIEDGEDCDDGNRINGDGCDDDCKLTCTGVDDSRCVPAEECLQSAGCNLTLPDTPICFPPVPKANGTACGTGTDICIAGNCRPDLCGDGFVSAGEDCDDQNLASWDGCTNDCNFECNNPNDCGGPLTSCQTWDCSVNHACVKVESGPCDCTSNGHCDDGDPCNGAETCDTGVCSNPADAADGTSCGTDRVCVAGGCRLSFCGDGYVAAGEQCDPPNLPNCDLACQVPEECDLSGPWAMKMVVDVTWPPYVVGGEVLVEGGTGQVVSKVLVNIAQDPVNKQLLTNTIRVCDLDIPDFNTADVIQNTSFAFMAGEDYGLDIPYSLFDSNVLGTTDVQASLGNVYVGATFTAAPAAVQIGVEMVNPYNSAWADLQQDPSTLVIFMPDATILDPEPDTYPGITLNVKTGEPYDYIVVNPLSNSRADQLHTIIRQISSQLGKVDTCDRISGTATVDRMDSHVVSCRDQATQAKCDDVSVYLADQARPKYAPTAGSFVMTRMTGTPTCADVRAEVP